MALKLETQYPGRTKVDANNPNGTFKNSAPAGSLNGTPGDFAWAKDMWSFFEILMTSGSVTHNDAPDDANASQRYNALVKISRDVWPIWDSAHEYSAGVITIGSDDNPYYSLQAANTNHDPTSSPAWWRNFSFEVLQTAARTLWPVWDATETYPKGVGTVGSDGNPYYSLQAANTNHDPMSSPTWWQLFEYTSLRTDARNVWPIWDSANTYIKGAIVIASDETTYQSLQNSNFANNPTSSPTWWEQFVPSVTVPATITVRGLRYLDQKIISAYLNSTTFLFSGGKFSFKDGSGEALVPQYSKTTAVWSAGNGGALDTGAIAPNTNYYKFAIYDPIGDVSDYLYSTSLTLPTLPGTFAKKRYIGAFYTDGASNIIPINQIKNDFLYQTPILFASGVFSITQTFTLLTPLAIDARAQIAFRLERAGLNLNWNLRSPSQSFYSELLDTAFASTQKTVNLHTDGAAHIILERGGGANSNIQNSAFYLLGWNDPTLED